MSKLLEAQEILKAFGLPAAQYNEMSALTLLALCQIKETDKWKDAKSINLGVSKGIMLFVNKEYKKKKPYAPNTRETFRRQVLHQLTQARIVDYNPDDPKIPVNSPRAHYAISKEALEVIKKYKTRNWKKSITDFTKSVGKLSAIYLKERTKHQIPLKLADGSIIELSPGKHNEVQAAIVTQFASRFANDGALIYLGDTANKNLYMDEVLLKKLGIPITQHSKLPDVIIYIKPKKWLFLIEAVTSHGPVSPKRMMELEELLKNCNLGKIYVSAFPDMSEFKRHSANIAWETEVWLMDVPDHMIHFNGDKFIGPHL
ncbi:MAG: BsuBI/PstI family type II restriction endonuclease [Ignavibacteria bacterium]